MDNPFSRLFGFGKADLSQTKGSIAALDIGSSSIKVIQLRKEKGRAILETYGELATGPYVGMAIGQSVNLAADKIVEITKDLFTEASVTTKSIVMSIPLRSSLLMALELPRLNDAELSDVVPLEARKYVPVPISEVLLDWWVIPEREDASPVYDDQNKTGRKGVEVLVAAIHRDTAKLYEDVAQRLGVMMDFFEIETFSAIRSVMRNDLSATAIVDLGAGTTKVAIVDYGVVRISHTINKGSQDITTALARSLNVSFAKAEEIKRQVGLVEQISEAGEVQPIISPIVEYIFSEVDRVIINYQKKYTRSVDKIILIGGGVQLKGLYDLAKKSIDIPVQIGTPFDKVETPAFMENVLREAGPSFAVAIGLSLRELQDL
ncbi:MAG: type IV pilus assembly protein PilM [Patescibacteria group bacterium]